MTRKSVGQTNAAVRQAATRLIDQLKPVKRWDQNRHAMNSLHSLASFAYACPVCGSIKHWYMHSKKNNGDLKVLEGWLRTMLQTMTHKKECAYLDLLEATGGPSRA